jgi:hypothetical protein
VNLGPKDFPLVAVGTSIFRKTESSPCAVANTPEMASDLARRLNVHQAASTAVLTLSPLPALELEQLRHIMRSHNYRAPLVVMDERDNRSMVEMVNRTDWGDSVLYGPLYEIKQLEVPNHSGLLAFMDEMRQKIYRAFSWQ